MKTKGEIAKQYVDSGSLDASVLKGIFLFFFGGGKGVV